MFFRELFTLVFFVFAFILRHLKVLRPVYVKNWFRLRFYEPIDDIMRGMTEFTKKWLWSCIILKKKRLIALLLSVGSRLQMVTKRMTYKILPIFCLQKWGNRFLKIFKSISNLFYYCGNYTKFNTWKWCLKLVDNVLAFHSLAIRWNTFLLFN